MPTDDDFYRVLQVDPSADPDVIEAAYKRLARKYHPDHNGGDVRAEEIFEVAIADAEIPAGGEEPA